MLLSSRVLQRLKMPSSSKKRSLKDEKGHQGTSKKAKDGNVLEDLFNKSRAKAGESVQEFDFNRKRVKLLTGNEGYLHREAKAVAYWMHRDQRVQDNWAMLFAQKLALDDNLPLHVVAGTSVVYPKNPEATRRALDFSLAGLQEVAMECQQLNIQFHLLQDDTKEMYKRVLEWSKKSDVGCIVADFSPLRVHRHQLSCLEEEMSKMNGPCLYQVDAHNVVPVWEASEKQELAARTIRPKITKQLAEFLTEFPLVAVHPVNTSISSTKVDWDKVKKSVHVDETVGPVDWALPGTSNGYKMLDSFVSERLKKYSDKRNDPNEKACSEMSPWFHYGQVGVQRAALYVKKYGSKVKSDAVAAFIEEAVVRGELSDNFCYYQENYDNLKGGAQWAQDTLKAHAKDKREYVYGRKQLENAETHDELWNAAQIQMMGEGKMHGFMRMYWAKKILEWSDKPELALENAIYLNDKYSLDGCDSNGYVGCMWSIVGVHDMGWTERPIFGKIRFMNYNGCKRKFNIASYADKYGPAGKK